VYIPCSPVAACTLIVTVSAGCSPRPLAKVLFEQDKGFAVCCHECVNSMGLCAGGTAQPHQLLFSCQAVGDGGVHTKRLTSPQVSLHCDTAYCAVQFAGWSHPHALCLLDTRCSEMEACTWLLEAASGMPKSRVVSMKL
jgi:hypothetical protein